MENYFVKNEDRKGTFYHEFYKGEWKKDYWNENSIFIDDIYMNNRFTGLIRKFVPDYDYSGNTEITLEQWQQIKGEGLLTNDETAEIIRQAEGWIKETFAEHKVFTILGI